jgi:fused signal recognition particle receptor
MAGFNWFRRSFDNSDASDVEAKSTESAKAEKPAENPQAIASTPQLSSEDYLKWAKAAYQNIQKQQSEAAGTSAPSAETVATPVELESASDVIAEQPQELASAAITPGTEESAAQESGIQESGTQAAATEPVAELEPEAPSVMEVPTLKAEVEREAAMAESLADLAPEPVPAEIPADLAPELTASANLPFWARAEEERQERLERLRETAIVEPEPAPVVQAAPAAEPVSPLPVLPDIDLDEAFLWSAEVLAAQGRRPDDISAEEITWLNRLRQGLNKTRLNLVNQLKAIVGQGPLNSDAVMEIEALLLQADVGVAATDKVIDALQARMRQDVLPPDQAIAYLKSILRDMLDAPLGEFHNLTFVPEKDTLNIWLMTGVNGAGKTTTIGKLAHIATKSGYNTLIAAADTFRAAAVEQVKTWGARSNVEVIANPGKNTDPAAVVYDAIAAAQSRNVELLLVDTAGRLQNKKNLMDELAKIRRIVDKKAPNANIEALLVLDATLGQNGLRQAEVFAEAANLSGVVLTKLDGTAKGGVALAVVEQLGLPIRFIGAGEGIEDLRPFSSYEFVEALLSG